MNWWLTIVLATIAASAVLTAVGVWLAAWYLAEVIDRLERIHRWFEPTTEADERPQAKRPWARR